MNIFTLDQLISEFYDVSVTFKRLECCTESHFYASTWSRDFPARLPFLRFREGSANSTWIDQNKTHLMKESPSTAPLSDQNQSMKLVILLADCVLMGNTCEIRLGISSR
nr:hypothetical protein HmN_000749300 [Hymenolepis microstoma]